MGEVKKVPKLRFPEFNSTLTRIELGRCSTVNPRNTELPESFIYVDLESVNDGILTKQERINKEQAPSRAQRLLKNNDILYQTVRPYQKNNFFFDSEQNDFVASTGYAQIRTKENPRFIYQYLHTNQFVNKVLLRCTGTSYPSINSSDLSQIEINLPALPEQTKIANFLTAVDAKIANLSEEKSLLENYKKGVMQKVFSQELRFKIENEDGELVEPPEWETKRGSTIFRSHSNKDHDGSLPILSASQQFGMVYREDNGIRIQATAESVKSYKVVESGDFVISLRSFQGGIEYSKLHGICSPAYIILKPKIRIDSIFFKFYFKKDSFIERLSKTVVGIRDGKQITYDAFGGLKLVLPSIEEQTKIGNFLTSIDEKINTATEAIEKAQEWKKGLLQQLFV